MATPTTLPSTFVAGNVLTAAEMNNLRGAFRVLQVVQTVKSDTFTGTVGTTPVDVTGLSVAITPSATSSKVLVIVTLNYNHQESRGAFRIVRDSTAISIGDAAGNRTRASFSNTQGGAMSFIGNFLDSPNTTSATTYKVQVMNSNTGAGSTVYINRDATDTDTAAFFRSVSTITAMEISA